MSWSVADARNRFTDLLEAAVREGPQEVARRGRPVAVVVSAEEFEAFREWRDRPARGLAEAVGDIALLCAAEGYALEVPKRRDRPSPFGRRGR